MKIQKDLEMFRSSTKLSRDSLNCSREKLEIHGYPEKIKLALETKDLYFIHLLKNHLSPKVRGNLTKNKVTPFPILVDLFNDDKDENVVNSALGRLHAIDLEIIINKGYYGLEEMAKRDIVEFKMHRDQKSLSRAEKFLEKYKPL